LQGIRSPEIYALVIIPPGRIQVPNPQWSTILSSFNKDTFMLQSCLGGIKKFCSRTMMVFAKMRSRCYLNNLIISFQIKRVKKLTISNITEELEIAEIAEILKGI
jgi:hypothetical protein